MGEVQGVLEGLREMGVCAFCAHHTHDFPDDSEYYQMMHDDGWHVCGVDGKLRHNRMGCPDFELSQYVITSDSE